MIDFTKLEEGQTVLFDFKGKTYERKVKVDHYIDVSDIEELRLSLFNHSGKFWIMDDPLWTKWKEHCKEYNVRFKPEYNFHVGQKVSYVINGETFVGVVTNGDRFTKDLFVKNANSDYTIVWLYCNNTNNWQEAEIEKYQVKTITITDMETPIEPDFDQQIINAKLEFADKMLFNGNETSLAALQVNQTLKKILSIEKQRKLHNVEQLWNRLRDQVVSDEDDEKFYDMIQDLELYYETKLKPITPKEFTSNDGC